VLRNPGVSHQFPCSGSPNDKQQLEPMIGKIADLPDELGKAEAHSVGAM
jgi:hypothetical protein